MAVRSWSVLKDHVLTFFLKKGGGGGQKQQIARGSSAALNDIPLRIPVRARYIGKTLLQTGWVPRKQNLN